MGTLLNLTTEFLRAVEIGVPFPAHAATELLRLVGDSETDVAGVVAAVKLLNPLLQQQYWERYQWEREHLAAGIQPAQLEQLWNVRVAEIADEAKEREFRLTHLRDRQAQDREHEK